MSDYLHKVREQAAVVEISANLNKCRDNDSPAAYAFFDMGLELVLGQPHSTRLMAHNNYKEHNAIYD